MSVRGFNPHAPGGVFSALRGLAHHRDLVKIMVVRDVLGRYRGSVMGMFWSIINPLVMLTLYTFVFSVILKVKFGVGGGTTSFALYLFCGMLPWLAFSDALTRATNVVADNSNLVKKVVFPLEILPINVTLSALVSQFFSLGILLAATLLLTQNLPVTIVLLPILLIPQVLFTLGMGWFLSSLGAYVRDLGHAIGLALTAWMFLTPIMYPESVIPQHLRWISDLNPMAVLVGTYRRLLLDGALPEWGGLMYLYGLGIAVFLGGLVFFNKLKKGFADVL